MKNLNESLLESIDLIQESTIESELNVLFAMGEEYAKACTLMEYADESVVNEFDLIQESAFFMEAKKDDAAEDKKEGETKEAKGDKKGNPIVRFFKWIGNAIIGFFKWLGKKFSKTEKKVNTKIKGKEKAALEKILNNTLAGVMGEVPAAADNDVVSRKYIDHVDTTSKDLKSAKEIYTLSKKKTFKVEAPNNQLSILVNMPFFYEKFAAVAKSAVKKSKDQVSFEFKNMVTFEYVSLSEIVGRINAESSNISTFINSELPKLVGESKLAGKDEKAANDYASHLKSMTEGFQGRMLRASMAFYDIVDTVVSDVMDNDLTES